MKKLVAVFSLFCFLALAVSSMAASGYMPVDKQGRAVQGHSPTPASSACTTTTVTKGVITTITNTWTSLGGPISLAWSAIDASNAAVVIKRYLNSNTAFMPGSSGEIKLNSGITSVAFKPYSAAGRAITVCTELQ